MLSYVLVALIKKIVNMNSTTEGLLPCGPMFSYDEPGMNRRKFSFPILQVHTNVVLQCLMDYNSIA
jgi:hypothetical protein